MPTSPTARDAVIGVWTTASRQTVKMINAGKGTATDSGPYVQVSRLGMPLGQRGRRARQPEGLLQQPAARQGRQFAAAVANPELAKLIPVLYPGAFPNLAAYQAAGKTRPDIVAIFATGIPASILPSAPTNVGGKAVAEMLRLNVAVAPTTVGSKGYSALGVIGGDIGGFPNGRRLQDDVVTIELQALAGATIPLVDKSYKVDAVVSAVSDGAPSEPSCYQSTFPYLADPHDGYDNPSDYAHGDPGLQVNKPWQRSQPTAGSGARGLEGSNPSRTPGPAPGLPDALVLDIGGDIGALIIYADETCLGSEIDLTPVGAPRSHHLHTMVRRRRATNKDVIAGLYPEVREGTYIVWGLEDSGPLGEVTVMGGQGERVPRRQLPAVVRLADLRAFPGRSAGHAQALLRWRPSRPPLNFSTSQLLDHSTPRPESGPLS